MGPALLIGHDGRQWLIDAEKGRANILFLPGLGHSSDWYRRLHIREPIAENLAGHPLRFLLREMIIDIEVISRDPEPGVPGSYAMCGLRLSTDTGSQVCVGTHLTDPPYPAVAFLLPDEVDPVLRYIPLTAFDPEEVRLSCRHQVNEAVGVARGLVEAETPVGPPVFALAELARRFAATEFNVPENPEADGYLFQYGKVNWLPEPTFVLGMMRQLEVVDTNGEHKFYSQVQFEYRYPLDGDLEAAGSYSEWWFPDGGTPFNSWLDSVSRSPIDELLRGREPREFLVWKDHA